MYTYVYVYIYIYVYVYVYKALDFQFLYPRIGLMMMTQHRNMLLQWLTSYVMKNTVVFTLVTRCLIHKIITRVNVKTSLFVTKRIFSLGKSG